MRKCYAVGLLCGLALFAIPLFSQTYATGTTPFTNSALADGAITSTQGFNNLAAWVGPDGSLRWKGNHSTIDATYWAAANLGGNAGSGVTLCLYQDDALVGTCITGAGDSAFHTSSGQWTGLSGDHEYRLNNVGANATGSITTNGWLNIISEVVVSGGTGLTGSKPAARNLLMGCGDSIAEGESSAIYDARLLDWWQIAVALEWSEIHYGASGATVVSTLAADCPNVIGNTPATGTAGITVVQTGGVNDANAGTTIGTPGVGCNSAQFSCAYYNMLSGTWATSPHKVYARGILPNSYTTSGVSLSPNIATYNAGIQAAVTQWNTDNPTKPVTYISTVGWFNPVTGTVADHLHPTQASYATMGILETAILGPASGIRSVVSGQVKFSGVGKVR